MAIGSAGSSQPLRSLHVGAALTVAEGGRIRDALLQAFGESGSLALDLADLVDVDVAGLQLLCSAHRFAVQHNLGITVFARSECLLALAQAAGFAHSTPCLAGSESPCLWTKMA